MDASQPSSSTALRAVARTWCTADELTFAIDTFLSQPEMTANTRRSYATTLRFIEREVGGAPLDAPLLASIVTRRWEESSPATWNLTIASVGSFLTYVRDQGLLAVPGELRLRRRRERHHNTRSLPIASIERRWQRRELPIRERTLWRMLYETAAHADEILGIDNQPAPAEAVRSPRLPAGVAVDHQGASRVELRPGAAAVGLSPR